MPAGRVPQPLRISEGGIPEARWPSETNSGKTGGPRGGGFPYNKISTGKAEPYAHLEPIPTKEQTTGAKMGTQWAISKKGSLPGKSKLHHYHYPTSA